MPSPTIATNPTAISTHGRIRSGLATVGRSICSSRARSFGIGALRAARHQRGSDSIALREVRHHFARNPLHLVQRFCVRQQAEVEVADHFFDTRGLDLLELMDDLLNGTRDDAALAEVFGLHPLDA